MLVVETIARIRREDFITGKTIKEIARDLKVSRNTVRKVLRSGEASFVRSGSPATTEARPVDGRSRRTADREYLLTPSVTKFRNIRWANDCCGAKWTFANYRYRLRVPTSDISATPNQPWRRLLFGAIA
jgi:transposase